MSPSFLTIKQICYSWDASVIFNFNLYKLQQMHFSLMWGWAKVNISSKATWHNNTFPLIWSINSSVHVRQCDVSLNWNSWLKVNTHSKFRILVVFFLTMNYRKYCIWFNLSKLEKHLLGCQKVVFILKNVPWVFLNWPRSIFFGWQLYPFISVLSQLFWLSENLTMLQEFFNLDKIYDQNSLSK